MMHPIRLFYSYAPKDESFRKELEKHLSLLKRQGLIAEWDNRNISAGTEWASEIDSHLNTAHVILLLISSDFLASDYCYSTEMNRALERHDAGEARVIPVLLRPVDLEGTSFSKLQALPTNRRPIMKWPKRDDAFLDVVQGIRRVVGELRATHAANPSVQDASVGELPRKAERSDGQGVGAPQRSLRSAFQSFAPAGWGEANRVQDVTIAPVTTQQTTSPIISNVFLFNQQLPSPDEFFGRARERLTLLDRTYKQASTSIVGPRRIGKTWLMSYLQLVAPEKLGSRFRLSYLDATAQQCATVAGFAASVLELLTLQKYTFTDKQEALLVLEEEVQELARNHVLVLCIDEFEGFGNRKEFDLHFFTALRALAHRYLCLVLASKQPLIDIVGDYGKTSGFFNVFKQCTLEPFSKKEAEGFVQSKGDQAHLTEQERQYLLRYGQVDGACWPIRLQLVGEMLLEDKILAMRENDPDYYRPADPDYWRAFERRLEQTYRGVVR